MTRPGVDARLRRVAAPVAVAAGVAAAGGALLAYGPDEVVPVRCPFLALTGLDCPLCGGTRSATALAGGDLSAALDLNAFTTVGLIVVAGLWLTWLVGRWRDRPSAVSTWTPGNRFWTALTISAAVFAVLRNLPGPTSALGA